LEKIELILTNCVQEIRSGRSTLSECLNRYPDVRGELDPLLKMALNIREPRLYNLDISYKQAAKARLLRQIRIAKQKNSKPFKDSFSFGLPPQLVWARIAVSVLVVVIVISMLASGTVYAAQGSLPGDLLYKVKTGTEDVRMLLATDSSARVELNLKFAHTRLLELSKLANSSNEKAALAVSGYKGNLETAWQEIRKVTDISAQSNVLGLALEAMQSQIALCDNIIDDNPAYLEPVREASNLSINQQVELLKMLAQHDILQAAQINLHAMQDRLQHAQAKASRDQYQMMQELLIQYEKFSQLGEQILQSARSTSNHDTEIEELNLQALSSYLDTLDSMSQQVPQEYQNKIVDCQQITLQFQKQIRQGYQYQGSPGSSLEESNSGNSDSPATEQDSQGAPQNQDGTGSAGSEAPDTGTAPTPGPGGSTGGEAPDTGTAPTPGPGGSTGGESPGKGTGPTPGPGENTPDSGGNRRTR